MLKKIDLYIIRKFLGTFFFSLALIVLIAIIFDISEKLDDFIERKAPLHDILFDYYLNFIPYFANLFAPLFVFISVIFFTSRMASNTEIIAMLNSGISFNRLLRPYLISAIFLALLSFYFNGWVIPHSNKVKLDFENIYIKNPVRFEDRDFHRQISPGIYIYMAGYSNIEKTGTRFSMEKIESRNRAVYLNSDRIVWDSLQSTWRVENYFIRTIDGLKETVQSGLRLDTAINMHPDDFKKRVNIIETMDSPALAQYIQEERLKGSAKINSYLVEKYKRIAIPVAIVILTFIGVAFSSRKVRGGTGVQLGIGIGLSFAYILFMQVSNTFAINGVMPALPAVWLPNFLFAIIALILLRFSPR